MFKPKMIENDKDFCCLQGHNQQVVTIVLDPKLSREKRLLCPECLQDRDIDGKAIGLRKIIQQIEENQVKKMEKVENIIKNQLTLIEQLHGIVDEMKQFVIQQLNQLISLLMGWIEDLQQKGSFYSQYSFYEELEIMILKQNKADDNLQTLINEVQQSNLCQTFKLYPILEQFNKFVEYNKCKEQLSKLELNCQTFTQSEQQQNINLDSQLQRQQEKLQEGEIKLKLIDQSVQQRDTCKVIVFDSSGSIMVSTQEDQIKVWKFLDGKIKLIKTLQGHTHWIQCLVYSKKQNSFISGENTIRCWQQLNQTDWISSQPYKQHTDFVRCFILNSKEDILFSGSNDQSIKVWKVDFNQNILIYMYSLNKHDNKVISLSLNESETQLVSCASDKNQIIIWERKEQDKFEFKYFVKQSIQEQGKKIKFIKENQFIWITGGKDIDKLYVFELNEGVFQDNQKKTLQLLMNNQIFDEYHFPIIYNKQRNLIIIRHKTYIYILREMNNGKFIIVDQLNCFTEVIYGTVTNTGQYLVFWDEKNLRYSTYELLYN